MLALTVLPGRMLPTLTVLIERSLQPDNEFTRRNITTRTGLIRQALLMEIDLPAHLLIALMVLLESTQLPQTGQKVSTLTGFLE